MYDREAAAAYAKKWAFGRNPEYMNFDPYGGDCTNFVSQCIYAGCPHMNFTPDTGWYYLSPDDRAPAWSATEYLYRFLTNNTGVGPRGRVVEKEEVQVGDIVQFADLDEVFFHTVFVQDIFMGRILISAHTRDAFMRPLNTYFYPVFRYIHILCLDSQEDNGV